MTRRPVAVLFGTLVGFLAGCAPTPETPPVVGTQDSIARAVAVLRPAKGYTAHGAVTFDREGLVVTVTAEVHGLTPGLHGFHVHTYGNCTDPDLSSAGGHFDPYDEPHGGPGNVNRHVGDLGNIIADQSGHAFAVITDSLLAFHGPRSIIGRAVIVHRGRDDMISQPSGDAGARVAGGVIGIAEEKSLSE
jgi:Cu-Zn family superoxide dismutase